MLQHAGRWSTDSMKLLVSERNREFLQNKLEAEVEENHFATPSTCAMWPLSKYEFQQKVAQSDDR